MPTTTLAIGVAETRIDKDDERTVLIIQKMVAANILFIYDESGVIYTSGGALAAQYASLTLRKSEGEHPEKAWYLMASGAATTTNVIELYGQPSIVEVRITKEPEEPKPQEPQPSKDAPKMRPIRVKETGYK